MRFRRRFAHDAFPHAAAMRLSTTAVLPPERVRRAPGYRVANAVSYLVNPLVLPPVAFALVQKHYGAGMGEVLWTSGVALVFFCLLPLGYVAGMVWRGEAESLEVRERRRRLKPFLAVIASYAAGLLVLGLTAETAPRLVVALAALYPLNTAVILLINLRWKISVHLTSLAGFVSGLLFVALMGGRGLPAAAGPALTAATVAPLLALVPLLMWARVRVRAHTPGQVLAGAAFGLAAPFGELYLLVRAWPGLLA